MHGYNDIYNSKLRLVGGTVEIRCKKEYSENQEKFQEENGSSI